MNYRGGKIKTISNGVHYYEHIATGTAGTEATIEACQDKIDHILRKYDCVFCGSNNVDVFPEKDICNDCGYVYE